MVYTHICRPMLGSDAQRSLPCHSSPRVALRWHGESQGLDANLAPSHPTRSSRGFCGPSPEQGKGGDGPGRTTLLSLSILSWTEVRGKLRHHPPLPSPMGSGHFLPLSSWVVPAMGEGAPQTEEGRGQAFTAQLPK